MPEKNFFLLRNEPDYVVQDGGDRIIIETIGTRDADVITEDLMYIESVQYTAPYGLQLVGGDDNRLDVFLAQKGYVNEDTLKGNLRSEFYPKDRDIVIPSGGGIKYEDSLYPPGEVPICGIIMWCGSVESIPTGFALCDGSNGTPDLRDRFIVGAGSTYSPGDTGGQTTIDIEHNHGPGTLNTDSDSHTHGVGTLDTDDPPTPGTSPNFDGTTTPSITLTTFDDHTHDITGSTASDSHDHDIDSGVTADALSTTQDILPLYYSLAYIMRIL